MNARNVRTIKEAAYSHLLEVVETDEATGKTVGLPYLKIIDRLKEEFPDCQTNVACLRWYASELTTQAGGSSGLPSYRPRARKTTT